MWCFGGCFLPIVCPTSPLHSIPWMLQKWNYMLCLLLKTTLPQCHRFTYPELSMRVNTNGTQRPHSEHAKWKRCVCLCVCMLGGGQRWKSWCHQDFDIFAVVFQMLNSSIPNSSANYSDPLWLQFFTSTHSDLSPARPIPVPSWHSHVWPCRTI